MKKWILVLWILTFLASFPAVASAGDRERGRWEGVAIGLGAVSLYNFFQHGQLSPVIVSPAAHAGAPRTWVPPVPCPPSGHWEVRWVWVPERRETVWVPGHYRHGYWVAGHYEVRIYPGHYVEKRVWVETPIPPSSRIVIRGIVPSRLP